jgi:hypothetical protein
MNGLIALKQAVVPVVARVGFGFFTLIYWKQNHKLFSY